MDRVGAHAGQGVDLLGDAHGAQLGRHGAADAAGQHGGGQHRAQLAHQRHVDDRAQPRLQVHLAELRMRLHGQHHADERARQGDDRQAQHADLIHTGQQRLHPRQPRAQPAEHSPGEQGDVPQGRDPVDGQAPQVGNQAGHSLHGSARRGRRRGGVAGTAAHACKVVGARGRAGGFRPPSVFGGTMR